jgi:hypothetical protein
MSCCFNAVSLKVLKDSDKSTDGVVWVSGFETYGDYYEVLDKKTGTMLARKVYREGFGNEGTGGNGATRGLSTIP